MSFLSIFQFIENPQNTDQSKHMVLVSALHEVVISRETEKNIDSIHRCVNELLKLVNVTAQPINDKSDINELIFQFLIQLSIYRSMIAFKLDATEVGQSLITVSGKLLYLTSGKGILEVLVGDPLRNLSEAQINQIQHDDILYAQLSRIKAEYENAVISQNTKVNNESDSTDMEIQQSKMVISNTNFAFKQRANQQQIQAIQNRLQELNPNASIKIENDVDLDLKKVDIFVSTLKMSSLYPCLSPITQALIKSECKGLGVIWLNTLKQVRTELIKKMFIESKNNGELDTAIQINVFDVCGETIISKYRKEYEDKDRKIQELMNSLRNAHPYHFNVETPFLLEEKGVSASPYLPVIETFKRISVCKYLYQKLTIGATLLHEIENVIDGFYLRTGKKREVLGAEQLPPLYSYLLFKSKYPNVYSDSMLIQDFLDDSSALDRRGHWISIHMQCVEFILSLNKYQMDNNLISSLITEGHEGTVIVIGMEGIGKTTLVKSLSMREIKTVDEHCFGVRCGKLEILEWDIYGDKSDMIPMQQIRNISGVVLCIPNIDEYTINTSFALAAPVLNSLKHPVPLLLLMTRHDICPTITLENFPKLTNLIFSNISRLELSLCSVNGGYGIYESFMKLRAH
ncbi:vacuolar sorting protein 9 (VPS9) domain containing protein [Entamoeba nuttalli P19]|uniref:Vacuolar sorting protein 9 (VPS9) domain containing protein n=1 Tax=Entamoeba nuttalli (strain P19) TaxID=1076696 RepID=K2G8D5_ENTNP|nr:vacuolar sorting protein 9 (VPS9) domain containing protein [Entamoeba nuttalli P19]EKE38656.1 vacuolar sorting protein 9 (VPS9) domain containing protein [Entamoeba nuttalli P19]|eukprot:XP_008859010.1 vacuolar sorting protein 9 (VPS9) domain containing protein [Entamoeba nuttalli P19]